MSIKMRQIVERRIVQAVVRDCLAAGYALNVDNGGDELELPAPSRSLKDVMAVMLAADEDRLWVCRPRKESDGPPDHRRWDRGLETSGWRGFGWVLFVYGNSGWDVVSDYTTNLEHLMAGANRLAEKYGG